MSIFTRRSIRKYDLTKKLTFEELKDICRAGMTSPTAKNNQQWNFIIVDDEEIIAKLSEVSKGSMILKNCNTLIAQVACSDEIALVPGMQPCDLGASQMNMMNYAREKNLGTCWIGIYPIKERMDKANEILNVPSDHYVFSLMAIGYPTDLSCFKEVDRYDETKIHRNRF